MMQNIYGRFLHKKDQHLANREELIGGYRLSSSAFSLMERQIGFDISDYVDGSVLIDAADIAKPHVIRLLNEYVLRWKLTLTTRRKSNLRREGDAKEASAYFIIYFASRENFV